METKKLLKNRQFALPAILISAALVSMIAGNVFAAVGYNNSDDFEMNPEMQVKHEEMQAKHQAVKDAISSGDYATFAEITTDKGHFSTINEDNFSSLMEIHSLREAGDREGARSIMDELGIEKPHKGMKKMQKNMKKKENRQEHREEMKQIFESGDYNTFLEKAPEKLQEKVTEENFELMIKAHELREAGDKEGAKDIMEELGLKPPHKMMRKGPQQ
ncbi:hypothetical protein HOG48_06330 [Candidatus Peregrinibacteria bacterium]|jgi:hypothetical protein|nr:hypothetical protein [Candidatus Peregrinibacteria bacterium]